MAAQTVTSDPLATRVYLEVGKKRVFTCALDWPGWARAGKKTEESALEAFAAYRSRYAVVARLAGLEVPVEAGDRIDVVERVPGTMTTDFGAPDSPPAFDAEPLSEQEADRQASLVEAAWTYLDSVVVRTPSELRKGPRGGGRDRDPMFQHVVAAELMYARKLGLRLPTPAPGDAAALAVERAAVLEILRSARSDGPTVEKGWRPRTAARRIAWHVLDHAWEMEDRAIP